MSSSSTFKPGSIEEPLLVKNPVGEGYINLQPFINAILEWEDERDVTKWPQKLKHFQENLITHTEDVEMNLDITDLDKNTYQNIKRANKWMLKIAQSIQIVQV